MTCVRTLAALVAILPLVAAQAAVGAPPAPPHSVSELDVTPEAVNPSDLNEAEYTALAAVHRQTPQYSLEQMASFVCRVAMSEDKFDKEGSMAAYDATKSFEEAKDAERAGRVGLDTLVRADAARQTAVQYMMATMRFPVRHAAFLGATTSGRLTIEDVSFRFGNLGGESIIRLHGQLRNSGDRPERIPVMTASAVDHFSGIVLAQEGYHKLGDGQAVPAHGVFPFDVTFDDAPQYTHEVKVNFRGPADYRNKRTCDLMKAFKAQPGQTLDVPRTGRRGPGRSGRRRRQSLAGPDGEGLVHQDRGGTGASGFRVDPQHLGQGRHAVAVEHLYQRRRRGRHWRGRVRSQGERARRRRGPF